MRNGDESRVEESGAERRGVEESGVEMSPADLEFSLCFPLRRGAVSVDSKSQGGQKGTIFLPIVTYLSGLTEQVQNKEKPDGGGFSFSWE